MGDAIGSDAIRDMANTGADKARGLAVGGSVIIAARNSAFVVYVEQLEK